MSTGECIVAVPELSNDERIQVFRRIFDAKGEFEGMEVDAYVVITDRYVIVLDTLLCPEDMATVMHMVQPNIAQRSLLIINSHADWDHAWGNSYFTGEHPAPIIAHKHCLTRLQSEEAQTELADFQNRYPLFQSVVLVPPSITFEHSLTIQGGDLSIELFAAPGHQHDHIGAWIPELRLLLAFDAVERPLPVIENAAAVPHMYATLEHFLRLQPQRVLCSHGKTTSIEMVQKNLSYLHEIERHSRALLVTHQPNSAELEQASTLIQYSLDEIIEDETEPVDRAFYSWVHDNNIRCVLQWLMQ